MDFLQAYDKHSPVMSRVRVTHSPIGARCRTAQLSAMNRAAAEGDLPSSVEHFQSENNLFSEMPTRRRDESSGIAGIRFDRTPARVCVRNRARTCAQGRDKELIEAWIFSKREERL